MDKDIINIKVVQKTINNEKKRFVNARELHKWLKVGKDFSNWIKDRIEKYDFIENNDYFLAVAKIGDGVKQRVDGLLIDSKTGRVIPKDYILTIDMAKEIAMLENNEIGKKVRKYFIKTEESFKKVMKIALQDPQFINQIAEGFKETREETKEYRLEFTDSINKYVAIKHYGTYTDMLYQFLFEERAKEYRKLLSLAKKDFTRNTMYEEILFIIGSFEASLAELIEKESNKLNRLLTKTEFIKIFNSLSSSRGWQIYQGRVKKIMATYDEELRNIKHEKLIDYKKEFQPKGTANLQFQRFGGFLFLPAPAARSRSARKGLILQRFATLRVAKRKCFGFGFGSSFVQSTKQNEVLQPIFFCFAFGETWKR